MKLILVRHTTTSWNRAGRIQGHTDIELDLGGREEARILGQKLIPFRIDKIISSDLKRARQTADIFSSFIHVSVLENARLRECSYGFLEGMTIKEIEDTYEEKGSKHWIKGYPYDFSQFGGERKLKWSLVIRH